MTHSSCQRKSCIALLPSLQRGNRGNSKDGPPIPQKHSPGVQVSIWVSMESVYHNLFQHGQSKCSKLAKLQRNSTPLSPLCMLFGPWWTLDNQRHTAVSGTILKMVRYHALEQHTQKNCKKKRTTLQQPVCASIVILLPRHCRDKRLALLV